MIISTPAAAGIIKNNKKKVEREYSAVIESIIPPVVPANLLPIAIAKYQIPNINAIIRPGTNLLK